jgi:putative copper export protein
VGAEHVIGAIHGGFAALFFGTLTYFSLVLFTKTNPRKKPTRRKLQRNMVYRVCGAIMAACILLAAVYAVLPAEAQGRLSAYTPIYWLEATAIVAFGISWLTKGEAILKDQ